MGFVVYGAIFGYFVVLKLFADWLERRYWRK